MHALYPLCFDLYSKPSLCCLVCRHLLETAFTEVTDGPLVVELKHLSNYSSPDLVVVVGPMIKRFLWLFFYSLLLEIGILRSALISNKQPGGPFLVSLSS